MQDKEASPADSGLASHSITEADVATTLRVMNACVASSDLWQSKAMREVRRAMAPLIEVQRKRMFDGKDEASYDSEQRSRKRAKIERQRAHQLDQQMVQKTLLRAGRLQKLEEVAAQDGADGIPLILDGVALEDAPVAMGRMLTDQATAATGGAGASSAAASAEQQAADSAASAATAAAAAAAEEEEAAAEEAAAAEAAEAGSTGSGGGGGGSGGGVVDTDSSGVRRLREPRACYICKRRFHELHHFYDLLCPTCAELNWQKRHQTADLRGRVALVSGARVKIGYHAAVKLLRCGASVIATTRFPHDAAQRFAALPDFAAWKDRLHVYGLDMRDLATVEAFCGLVTARYPRLDCIINNACQTVRRPPAYFQHLLDAERKPLTSLADAVRPLVERDHDFVQWRLAMSAGVARPLLQPAAAAASSAEAEADADAAMDGAADAEQSVAQRALAAAAHVGSSSSSSSSSSETAASLPRSSGFTSAERSQMAVVPGDDAASTASFPTGLVDVNKQQIDLRSHTSWTMRLHEVSTGEVAEVMAINAIAPFILNSKLKPLMMAHQAEDEAAAAAAWAMKQSSSSSGGSSSSSGGGSAAASSTAVTAAPASTVPATDSSTGAQSGARSLSLAESLLQSGAVGRACELPPGKAEVRGRAVGGAGARPRRDVGGGPVHGGKASHRVWGARCRFIVNVSAMEGRFYRAKMPTHPHTNMAKASLNMMTRTSAADYATSFIYMTAVDTGWINDEQPIQKAARTAAVHNFATPLDEVDAAARILDPIFAPLAEAVGPAPGAAAAAATGPAQPPPAGDGKCEPLYGCFLKDYFISEW